jgi:hypothetical protein
MNKKKPQKWDNYRFLGLFNEAVLAAFKSITY